MFDIQIIRRSDQLAQHVLLYIHELFVLFIRFTSESLLVFGIIPMMLAINDHLHKTNISMHFIVPKAYIGQLFS